MIVSDSELMKECIAQLAKSHVGRNAMRHMLQWLDEDGLLLDFDNRQALLTLLSMAWGKYAGSARDAMRDALS